MKAKAQTTSPSSAFVSANLFTNAEAQDLAFRVSRRGAAELRDVLASRQGQSKGRRQRACAACEILAAANGHADVAAGACALLEDWLFMSAYVPDAALVNLALRRLDEIIGKQNSAADLEVPVDRLRSLRARLAQPPRSVSRKPPRDDRPSFRELARWLNASQGEVDDGPRFDRRGNARVVLVHVTVNAASKLINYRKVPTLELWLNNNNDPKELAAAVKILLRGWRATLTTIEFDHVLDLTTSDKERQPPYRALTQCRTELADLPMLERFTTQNMYFDDDTLLAVCSNRRLQDINIVNAKISANGFRQMATCKTLERVSLSRCPRIGEADQEYLAAHLPNAEFVAIGK
jgi:hypothetical protein